MKTARLLEKPSLSSGITRTSSLSEHQGCDGDTVNSGMPGSKTPILTDAITARGDLRAGNPQKIRCLLLRLDSMTWLSRTAGVNPDPPCCQVSHSSHAVQHRGPVASLP
jgi:hypothetical protein